MCSKSACTYKIESTKQAEAYGVLVITKMVCLRHFHAVFSLWRSGFGPRSIHVEIVVYKVAAGLVSSTSVFPCQYHSTVFPHSFIHLSPMLCSLSWHYMNWWLLHWTVVIGEIEGVWWLRRSCLNVAVTGWADLQVVLCTLRFLWWWRCTLWSCVLWCHGVQ